MKITFSNIIWEGSSKIFPKVTKETEKMLELAFDHIEFGGNIRQLTVVSIALSADPWEIQKFYLNNNKIGYYKDWKSGERIKYMSIALVFAPLEIEINSACMLRTLLLRRLAEKLDAIDIKIPKKFSYEEFSRKLKECISLILMSVFEDDGNAAR